MVLSFVHVQFFLARNQERGLGFCRWDFGRLSIEPILSEEDRRAVQPTKGEHTMDSKGRALVLVIGAGPSGLVAAKTLLENGFRVRLVESSGKVGGTFRNKSYDDGRLVSSKQITCFSDFRMGADVDDHPLITDYIEYLERYCSEFKLWPHIQFNTRLERLDKMRSKKGGRVVGYRARLVGCGPRNEGKVSVEDYDLVSICTGNPSTTP